MRAIGWVIGVVVALAACAPGFRAMPVPTHPAAAGIIAVQAWEEQGALAGATVTVAARGIGPRTQVTDAGGETSFTVAPYQRYSVTVEYLGFETRRFDGIDVIEGRTTSLAVVLRVLSNPGEMD